MNSQFYYGGNPAGETGQRLPLWVFESEEESAKAILIPNDKIIAIMY